MRCVHRQTGLLSRCLPTHTQWLTHSQWLRLTVLLTGSDTAVEIRGRTHPDEWVSDSHSDNFIDPKKSNSFAAYSVHKHNFKTHKQGRFMRGLRATARLLSQFMFCEHNVCLRWLSELIWWQMSFPFGNWQRFPSERRQNQEDSRHRSAPCLKCNLKSLLYNIISRTVILLTYA